MSDLIELIAEVDNWNRISTKRGVFRPTVDSDPFLRASHHAEKETQCH